MTRLLLLGPPRIPRRTARAHIGVLAAAAAVLAACTTQVPRPPSPQPRSGTVVTSEFRFDVPDGFYDAGSDVRDAAQLHAPGAVLAFLLAAAPAAAAGGAEVRASIAISRIDSGPIPPGAVAAYLSNVELADASDLSAVRPISVGGQSGQVITYGHLIGGGGAGVAARSDDLVVTSAGASYEIVLDCAATEFTIRDAAFHRLLASWQWPEPSPVATPPRPASSAIRE